MAHEPGTILRKSLDAVDRHRKRMFAAVAIVTAVTVWAQYRLVAISRSGDLPRVVVAAVVVLEFWTAIWACAVVLQLTVMTRRILRAIELASKDVAD